MRVALLSLLGACTLCGIARAQESPAQVTEAQVSVYQSGVENGCRQAGLTKGDAEEKVQAFCGCLMKTLVESMSPGEWQQAFFYSRNNLDREEIQVLGRHSRKVAACAAPAAHVAPKPQWTALAAARWSVAGLAAPLQR